MCDRWFGHLIDTLRVTGVLDEALVVVTSDHGHSLWERRGYIGKRGYPSDPESYELPLMVRHPAKLGAGTRCDAWVQHHDISATLLEAAGVEPVAPIDGRSFLGTAFAGGAPIRDHVTVGWGSAMTVIDDKWWMNCKVNGHGAFLHDSPRPAAGCAEPRRKSTPASSSGCSNCGKADGGGTFPEYLLQQAESADDAPWLQPISQRFR
jgi:membrane-anchored protein YejM (alkaline phosphatase superfamily)